MSKYLLGERLSMKNADNMSMSGQVVHVLTVKGKIHYLVRYETGVTVPHSEVELDRLVVFSW